MKFFKFWITYVQKENPSKSFDLVTRTISVGHICFDINALKQISQSIFTAAHPFFTYQNIFSRVENIQFFTKKSIFATKIKIFGDFRVKTCRNLSKSNKVFQNWLYFIDYTEFEMVLLYLTVCLNEKRAIIRTTEKWRR